LLQWLKKAISHMSHYKKTFANYTSEHLLEKRALGNDLADEAHRAIEEIFAERGEYLPPIPTQAIDVQRQKRVSRSWFEVGGWIFLLLFINGIAKQVAHTWVGIVFTVGVVIYALVKWFHTKSLSKEEQAELKEQERIKDDGLYELMVVAAKGDLQRVKELLDYGADVNVVSVNGATALMYAARNNHIEIAKTLIDAGANVNVANDKKSTALSIASKQQNNEMVELLKQHGAR
jgi:Ankyrin repeats (3 copies)